MKILICIPHFFEAVLAEEARYGSENAAKQQEKKRSLAKCIGILHLLFGRRHVGANHRQRIFEEVPNECAHSVTVKVVTVPEKHLLSEIGIPSRLYEHVPINADPRHIGFETHKVIRSHAGQYDYYGYLEDDIVIHDHPLLPQALLFQPQRFRCRLQSPVAAESFRVVPRHRQGAQRVGAQGLP